MGDTDVRQSRLRQARPSFRREPQGQLRRRAENSGSTQWLQHGWGAGLMLSLRANAGRPSQRRATSLRDAATPAAPTAASLAAYNIITAAPGTLGSIVAPT